MILPMNAKTAPPDKIESLLNDPRYVAEIKYDGYRAIFEGGKLHSRLGNTFDVPEITKHLKGFDVILDGELYIPGGNSSDITTALGKDGDKSKLRYIIFDYLGNQHGALYDERWATRRWYLEAFYSEPFSDLINLSAVYYGKMGLHTLDEAMAYIESQNIEGLMLKNINAPYLPDKRPTNNWWKIKKHMTYDVIAMGYEEGKGKYKGLIGSIVFGLYKDGLLTQCGKCSGITDEMRQDITENRQEYLGRVIEIAAMERTKDGNFRHPVFKQWRTDKLPEACLWNQ